MTPLRFFLQRHYSPAGIVQEVDKGITATLTPAYVEWGLQLTGDDLTAVLYQFPRSDDVDLLSACLNESVTPLFRVLTGPAYGEALRTLIADQWPDLHGLLAHRNADVPGTRKLCEVITNEATQWIVVDEVSGAQRSAIPIAKATRLIGGCRATGASFVTRRTHGYPTGVWEKGRKRRCCRSRLAVPARPEPCTAHASRCHGYAVPQFH